MIKEIEGFAKHIAVLGFRGVRLDNVDAFIDKTRKRLDDVSIQLFDAKLIAGWQHLYFATLNALKSFRNKTNISKSLAVECLLYASAQNQIKVALNLIGINKETSDIAVLVVADDEDAARNALSKVTRLIPTKRDDTVIDLSPEKTHFIKKLFGISDVELETKSTGTQTDNEKALFELVIEHVALLVTQR